MFLASSSSCSYTYDVFLSFRGVDTRHGLTGNLFKALRDKGIRVFFDDQDLKAGDHITPSLLEAIQGSRIAIPVFSKNYASSSFCLDELSHIMDCLNREGRLVLPVFYDVDPSDVRHQKGTFAEAMARHEDRFKDELDKVHKWREALRQAADLSGEHFKPRDEYEYVFVDKIVKWVSSHVSHLSPLHVANHPVGLESRVLEVNKLLDDRSDAKVHMLGIYGIGGIGKSTLARALYNSIRDEFDGVCFLENVRENSTKHGLPHLQQTLLSKLVKFEGKLVSSNEGIALIKQRLCTKKVLLVLDDVDKLDQLQACAGGIDWFGFGSCVIITTRDSHLLVSHGVQRKYDVEGLNKKEAFELLTQNAFKHGYVDPSYTDVINHALTYACGLPLALEVIGSNLVGKSVEEWRYMICQYERIPHKEILKILKVSFDALEESQQKIFLDIACHFNRSELKKIEDILCCRHDFYLKCGINVLIEKSLIKINEKDQVILHDLIEDMGREIVRQESPQNPGERSRIWLTKDIVQVLEENTGTSAIEIICQPYMNEAVEWDGEAFKKMSKLQILLLGNEFDLCPFPYISQGPKYLPSSLRVLIWPRYPSTLMCIDKQKFVDLTVFKVHDSEIEDIPDISGALNLIELSFLSCGKLIEVHESIGRLNKLRTLDFTRCYNLESIPTLTLPSLEKLNLSYCSSLEIIPTLTLPSLEMLNLSHCSSLESIPPLTLPSLKNLNLSCCSGLESIPALSLPSLKNLNLFDCPNLESILALTLPSLEKLDLSYCSSLERFPEVFQEMKNIEEIDWKSTPIKEFLSSFANLTGLRNLVLEKGDGKMLRLPRSICMMPNLVRVKICGYEGLWLARQDEGEEQTGNFVIPSKAEHVTFSNCGVSDESFPILLDWFRNVKYLDLQFNDFTVVPESVKELRSLKELILDYCVELREIRGLPQNIECLSLKSCKSLTSSTISTLLGEELHNSGVLKRLSIPGSSIPEWFDHITSEHSIAFWFRKNNLPLISLCFAAVHPAVDHWIVAQFIINGCQVSISDLTDNFIGEGDHILIDHDLNREISANYDGSEKEWNHLECRLVYADYPTTQGRPSDSKIGIYVHKGRTRMENIRFVDPLLHQETVMQQQSWLALLGSLVLLELELEKWLLLRPPPTMNSNSIREDFLRNMQQQMKFSSSALSKVVLENWLSLRFPQDRMNSLSAVDVLASHFNSLIEEPFEETEGLFNEEEQQSSTRKRKTSTSSSDKSKSPSKIQKIATRQVTFIQEEENLLVLKARDHDKDSDAEVVETAIVLTATSTLSSIKNKGKQTISETDKASDTDPDIKYLGTLPFDTVPNAENYIGAVQSSSIDEDDMEAFYASVEAETTFLSNLQDIHDNVVSTRTRPSEETQAALQNLRDLVSKKFSLLVNPGNFGLMKGVLEHLMSLPTDEGGVSLRTKSVIEQLSTSFGQWSLDYNNANLKLESAAEEQSKAEKLKEELEANVKEFRRVVTEEKVLCAKLASLEEKKRELEEQINATKFEIVDFSTKRDIIAKRKKEVFDSGKLLKNERDDLRKKVPMLKAEQEVAKATQANIEVEWSKLGEQVIESITLE